MQVDIWQLLIVTGGWSGAIMALATLLHNRRVKHAESLEARIVKAEERAAGDHKALAVQIHDTNRQIAEHYVRRVDLEHALRSITDAVEGNTEAIIEGNKRVDQLFQGVEWRKGSR